VTSSDTFRSAADIARAVRAGDTAAVDVVEAHIDRIRERGDVTNAFVTVLAERARERAAEIDEAVAAGEDPGPLAGVPLAVKDLTESIEGVRHTYGCEPLSDNVADHSTVTVRRLEAAGAVIVGTTNTPELGHTPLTYNELQGPTGTPFDPERNAGGSSGGSAASLADGLAALATGSDVGGSLRNPASCCGVVSVKPSFGLVPKETRPDAFYSHSPFGVLGPMARSVEDAGLMLDVLAGQDDVDPFSVPAEGEYHAAATSDASADEFAVGYTPDLDRFAVEQSVRGACADAIDAFADAGADVTDAAVGGPDKGELTFNYGKQATVFFATIVDRLEEQYDVDFEGADADRVSPSLLNTLGMGRGYGAEDYMDANVARTAFYDAVEDALDGLDALAVPVLATPPLENGAEFPNEIDGENVAGLPMDWMLSWPFNLSGHPVVTVPAGLTDDGLPVGLQLVGHRYDEERLLELASAYEDANPWSYPGAE
jgi:Asp-tRNA(Asn)/Glu-tRNA(Gln) amidotransferase A subunit family amidase